MMNTHQSLHPKKQTKRRRQFRTLAAATIVSMTAQVDVAGAQIPTILDWSIDSLTSSVLGETRRISVALPPTYATKEFSTERYPVVIVLDGTPSSQLAMRIMQFRFLSRLDAPLVPEMIIVAVETNRNRVRDMSPPLPGQPDRPDRGGAPKFATFLTEELLDWLGSKYRTSPYTVVAGHSMSGLFAAWMYGHSSNVNAVIALSPSLHWYEPAAYDLVLQGIRERTAPGHLFVGASEDEGVQIARITTRLVADLEQQKQAATVVSSQRYTGVNHHHVEVFGFADGLQSIFRPLSLGGMERHLDNRGDFVRTFGERRKQYVDAALGFGLLPRLPSVFTFNLAAWLVSQPSMRPAVPMLCDELRTSYPGGWRVHACDGEYKLVQKDLAGAEASFKTGLALAEQNGYIGALPMIRDGIARVERAKAPR